MDRYQSRWKCAKNEVSIEKFHLENPLLYLWIIGVRLICQCKGIGSILMKEIIEECNRKERPDVP